MGKALQNKDSPVIIEEENHEGIPKQTTNDEIQVKQVSPSSPLEKPTRTPPFSGKLMIEKLVMCSKFDIVKNIFLKIPLLQEIKDTQIHTKTIRELCIKTQKRTPL